MTYQAVDVDQKHFISADLAEEIALWSEQDVNALPELQVHFDQKAYAAKNNDLLIDKYELTQNQLKEYAIKAMDIRGRFLTKA